jgi:hypothetical protein
MCFCVITDSVNDIDRFRDYERSIYTISCILYLTASPPLIRAGRRVRYQSVQCEWRCKEDRKCDTLLQTRLTRPPYCNFGGISTRPRTSIIELLIVSPNSWTYGSVLKSALWTKLLISLSRSGADLAVALIMVDVCISVNFLIQRWPATMLHTWIQSRI